MSTIEVAVPFRGIWYFDAICAAISDRARLADVDVDVIVTTPGAEGRALATDRLADALRDPACVGAIAVGFEFRPEQVERLIAPGNPVVVIGGRCPGLPSIRPDEVEVARVATRHLLDMGHESIAHLAGYALVADDFTMRSDRVRGYSDAMREAGLEQVSHVVPCEFNREAAYRAATRLLSEPEPPTAVFAVADELAFAVLDAARDLGLSVPRDLSVVGIDDHPEAAARGLTTWRQDPRPTGDLAVERVLGLADFDERVLELSPVERTSAAPPVGGAPRGRRGGWLFRALRGRR